QRLEDGNWTASDALIQGLAFDKLHHQKLPPADDFQPMDCGDIRMIQRCQQPRFTLEARDPIRIARECFGQDLDRYTSAQLRIGGLVDVTHAAGSNMTLDFVMRDSAS